MAKVILHIDLDAFFASVEISKNPSFKDKPLIVGGKFKRGVVSAASYPARKYGVHSGMPIGQALKLCPHLINVDVDMETYKAYSNMFFEIIRDKCGDKLEIGSIDECYVDFTSKALSLNSVEKYLKSLQQYVSEKLGITCSIGVAPNKFLAKMASDMNKPNGVTILRKRDIKKKLWPLPIEKMYGVGRKTAPRLRELGVTTIGELANSFESYEVRHLLGKGFFTLIEWSNGNDKREVVDYHVDAKSIGNSRTFMRNLTDIEEVKKEFLDLAASVSNRIVMVNSLAFGLSIVIKYEDFSVNNRSQTYDRPICNKDEIYLKALKLFEDNYIPGKPVRLLGITLTDIRDKNSILKQLNIFDMEINKESTNDIINKLNEVYGKDVFKKASKVGGSDD